MSNEERIAPKAYKKAAKGFKDKAVPQCKLQSGGQSAGSICRYYERTKMNNRTCTYVRRTTARTHIVHHHLIPATSLVSFDPIISGPMWIWNCCCDCEACWRLHKLVHCVAADCVQRLPAAGGRRRRHRRLPAACDGCRCAELLTLHTSLSRGE
eukprot:221475-Chlamydomonas_euryale.AAC.19